MTFRPIFGPEDQDLGPLPPQFRFRRRRTLAGLGGWNKWIVVLVFLVLLFIVLNVLKSLYVDLLWFDGAGYASVYSTMVKTRIALFFGGALLFLVYFGGNLYYAARLALREPAANVSPAEAASLRRLYALGLIAAALFFAVIFGANAGGRWEVVLQYLNRESFGIEDPQFNRDLGFYVFTLPMLRFVYGWLMGVAVITTLGVAALYLFRYFVVGFDDKAVKQTRIHLSLLLVAVIALFVWRYWLDRFELNFSTAGVVFGATYTDIHARLPFLYVGMAMGLITIGAILFSMFRTSIFVPSLAMGVWILVAIAGGSIYPASLQRLTVEPNELERERVYIQRNIEATRAGFGLDAIEERPYPASPSVTSGEVGDNPETINNIRLLDTGPLRDTYAQIQTIRPLYRFNNIDIDRYVIDGVRRQVMLSARELSSSLLPANNQSWVNKRLQFTHGYGAVVSPVNEVVQEGLPNLFLQDIPVTGKITVTEPGIYYGEEPEHYVIVKTRAQEFDYPEGDTNVQTVFDGEGGVQLSNILRRAVFAWEFRDLNILISDSLTSESRILFVRNIQDRVNKLAPFLLLDNDPYLVISEGKMYWIQDAYSTSSRYPYSTPGNAGYNYIRNSVKVVIDAYDGTTTLYLVEDEPITRSWARIFPDLFTPGSEMPAALQAHTRYPEDLFLVQVEQYRTYHIRDAGVLYNREDIWQVPNVSGVPVLPYYVIMRLPGETQPEFMLILPLTPTRRDNTIAWIAARSDAPNYGKLLTYRFPTETQIFGPQQVESRIDQDPTISAQFSLWDTSGSNVIRGNLLMIPIGNGNIFVEPIYLQAESSRLPELKRVIVVNGNQIAMEPTLERALAVLFGAAAPTPPTLDPDATPATGSPTPAVSPTAAATAQATPVVTPTPGGTPATVGGLAREADAAYERAQQALQRGDFATYGVEIARVEALIQQIVELTTAP